MAINLKGYTTVIDASVYSNDLPATLGDQNISVNEIMLLNRYSKPTSHQVMHYIGDKAGTLEGAAKIIDPTGSNLENKGNLDQIIMQFPTEVLSSLKEGEGKFAKFISDCLKNSGYNNGTPGYVLIKYGFLPYELSDSLKGASSYDSALESTNQQGYGLRWELRLMKDFGVLPKKKEIMKLLSHGQPMHTKTMDINTDNYPNHEVQNVLSALYSGFGKKMGRTWVKQTDLLEELPQIDDEILLEQVALNPIMELYQRLVEHVRQQNKSGPTIIS